jgi:HEAT repeat protein
MANLLLLLGLFLASPEDGPDRVIYRNRTLRTWLKNFWLTAQQDKMEQAENNLSAFVTFDERAVPAMRAAFQDPDEDIRAAAAYALASQGTKGFALIPDLIGLLERDKSTRVRRCAVSCLAAIEPEIGHPWAALLLALKEKVALPAIFRAAAHDEESGVRVSALAGLRSMRYKPKTATPVLIAALKDQDGQARSEAAFALAEIADAKTAAPALIAAMRGSDQDAVGTFAPALREIGAEGVPYMVEALSDKDEWVRAGAAKALGTDSCPDLTEQRVLLREAVPRLVPLLKENDPFVRECATQALGAIGRDAVAAVPALIETLKDKDPLVRIRAVLALGKIGPGAARAVPDLIAILTQDASLYTRQQAADALGGIGRKAFKAVPALIEALKHDKALVRYSAANALGRIGPAAWPAIPALREAVKEGRALGQIASNALESIQQDGPQSNSGGRHYTQWQRTGTTEFVPVYR